MKNTIINLWNGSIAPIHKCGRNDAEIENLIELVQRNRQGLDAVLNEDQKAAFEKYTCCMDEYTALMMEQAFCEGFSLGSKLFTQALTMDE